MLTSLLKLYCRVHTHRNSPLARSFSVFSDRQALRYATPRHGGLSKSGDALPDRNLFLRRRKKGSVLARVYFELRVEERRLAPTRQIYGRIYAVGVARPASRSFIDEIFARGIAGRRYLGCGKFCAFRATRWTNPSGVFFLFAELRSELRRLVCV